MKKIIKKFWGVALIVTLLASMLVSAAPAAAGTLAWGSAGNPNPAPGGVPSNQVVASDANIVRVAPNGDIFVVDNQASPLGSSIIWKSTDGGQTWSSTGTVALSPLTALPVNYVVVDLQISPSYTTDSTVFILINTTAAALPAALASSTIVMVSTNAGASFAQLGGTIGAGFPLVGTSLAIEPTYMSGVGQIAVGLMNPGVGGDIYT